MTEPKVLDERSTKSAADVVPSPAKSDDVSSPSAIHVLPVSGLVFGPSPTPSLSPSISVVPTATGVSSVTPTVLHIEQFGSRKQPKDFAPNDGFDQLVLTKKLKDAFSKKPDDVRRAFEEVLATGDSFTTLTDAAEAVFKALPGTGVPKAARTPQPLPKSAAEVYLLLQNGLTSAGPGDTQTTLTASDLATLAATKAHGRESQQIADHAVKLVKAKGTPSATGAPVATIELLRLAKANRDKDPQLDTSPALKAPIAEQDLGKLKADLPHICLDAPMWKSLTNVCTEVVDTELLAQLWREMVPVLINLDSCWLQLKPKSCTALAEMYGKISEFGGMRGAIGETSAAVFACLQGRTDVSISNEKLFKPDTPPSGKPKPGVDSQDVDVTSNKGKERFYTEAKYDMATFLSKARDSHGKAATTSSGATDPDADAVGQLDRYRMVAERTKTLKARKQARTIKLEVFIANPHGWPDLFFAKKVLPNLIDANWSVWVSGCDLMTKLGDFTKKLLKIKVLVIDAGKGPDVTSGIPSTSGSPVSSAVLGPTDAAAISSSPSPSITPKTSARKKKYVDVDGWFDVMSDVIPPGEFLTLPETDIIKLVEIKLAKM